ncbi:hypothetical protein [Pseudomonas phage PMBT14]|uniref:Uncharacterized protein n=1 Tax=Pseudomonas phage PMBT14 TaxID=2059855 RepID=A0A2S1B6A1_9CAUD|nr:hypothetical protein HWB42_gp23 [Pseudomonas phage PMBT14]AWC67976.1 hypothetical protein [Pseudomonas phage PMBT14]
MAGAWPEKGASPGYTTGVNQALPDILSGIVTEPAAAPVEINPTIRVIRSVNLSIS